MKRLFLLTLNISFFFTAFSKEPIEVSSKIETVTVYTRGAQIQRTATKSVEAGVQTLVFSNLSNQIDQNSIQVKGVGDFTILSVTQQHNYLSIQAKTKEVLALEDSLEKTNDKIEINKKLREVYESERDLLNQNKTMKVNEKSLFVEDLEELANFFRERNSDLALKTLEINRIEKLLIEKRNQFQNQLNELNNSAKKSTGEIVVEISAEKKALCKFEFSYFVHNAGWNPSYDIRAKDVLSPISVDYKAGVWQNTGEDWENIKLSLSTGAPTRTSMKPIIRPWKLIIQNFNAYRSDSYGGKFESLESKKARPQSVALAPADKEAYSVADFSEISENQLNVSFDIKIPYTITSNGKSQSVQIQKLEMKADYEYYTAPKFNNQVFLLARIANWGTFNLLSGSEIGRASCRERV